MSGQWTGANHIIVACPGRRSCSGASRLRTRCAASRTARHHRLQLLADGFVEFTVLPILTANTRIGFLGARKERQRLAACAFWEQFSFRVPDDRIVLRCFFGGIGDAEILSESDDSVTSMAREELRRILGLTAAPISRAIARWPRSMAQYTLGHKQRIEEIRARVAAIPGLHLAGNAFDGIGIPDCIQTGRTAAQAVLTSLS